MALSPSKLHWYWHRLSAMSPREVLLRLQKKAYQKGDRTYRPPDGLSLEATGPFPKLPSKQHAPAELLRSVAVDAEEILSGRWRAFGHLPLAVSDPLRWQADYLVNQDLQSARSAFKLDHRAQPGAADIKVIWEPNRWYQLVRLAMAAWLLDHAKAQEKCVEWLHHWATTNPPFTGLNWTSGLETGLRLIQFTWIDSLLEAAGVPTKTRDELRGRILPPHVRYTWRYKSFGSSANNHLIGELAGLIIAQARWPALAKLSAPIAEIGRQLDREVLAQFAEDGGNQEQALGYHLFSWEFCFQCDRALESAGSPLSSAAKSRLSAAARFYGAVKQEEDKWDFGDSDNAWVTPLFANEREASKEWWRWFNSQSPALQFWWGINSAVPSPLPHGVPPSGGKRGDGFTDRKALKRIEAKDGLPPEGGTPYGEGRGWTVFAQSGYAVFQSDDWFLRFDFSPLGYLSMAPHGHLDALHLSVSFRGEPIIIDPGTGAYYADRAARNYLAGWAAHNGPHLKDPPLDHPKRFGTFLWGEHHKIPRHSQETPLSIRAEIDLPYGKAERTVTYVPEKNAIRVADKFAPSQAGRAVITRWKFAPHWMVDRKAPNEFQVGPIALLAPGWKMARTYNPPPDLRDKIAPTIPALGNIPIDSVVSPAFRAIAAGSYLALEADTEGPFELLIAPA